MDLSERTQYKQLVAERLLSSPVITQALSGSGEASGTETAKQRIFPYRFTQFPLEPPEICISFDVLTAKSATASIHTNQLYLWICCRKGLLAGESCETRADQLAAEADRLLTGSDDFGIGRLQWEGMQLYEPDPEYYGYVLQYSAPGFSRRRSVR